MGKRFNEVTAPLHTYLNHSYFYIINESGLLELHYAGKYCSKATQKSKSEILTAIEVLRQKVCFKKVVLNEVYRRNKMPLYIGFLYHNNDLLMFIVDNLNFSILIFENQIKNQIKILNSFKYGYAHRLLKYIHKDKIILVKRY